MLHGLQQRIGVKLFFLLSSLILLAYVVFSSVSYLVVAVEQTEKALAGTIDLLIRKFIAHAIVVTVIVLLVVFLAVGYFVADIDIHTARSFGLQIITSLVEKQLRGTLQVSRAGGTCYCIRFTEPVRPKRI